jgi:hypothetical protein
MNFYPRVWVCVRNSTHSLFAVGWVIALPDLLPSLLFWAWLRQGSDAGAASLGNVDILVHSGPEADSYFSILLPDPSVKWRKAWFLVKNDANASLPTFTGGRLVPHPN